MPEFIVDLRLPCQGRRGGQRRRPEDLDGHVGQQSLVGEVVAVLDVASPAVGSHRLQAVDGLPVGDVLLTEELQTVADTVGIGGVFRTMRTGSEMVGIAQDMLKRCPDAVLINYVNPMSMLTRDKILWSGLVLVGTYASYALGANNVANATGIFSGQVGLTDRELSFLGGTAIALGVMTYSRRVMLAVGSQIIRLNASTAFITVASMAVTVHIFAMIGVPVSTSQAIVGAIVGIGQLPFRYRSVVGFSHGRRDATRH